MRAGPQSVDVTLADIHELAPNLFVIEGHDPHRMWEDPDIPSIALYRHQSRLYILDSGVGPEQRGAILEIAGRLGPLTDVVLLNSHGHLDHLGNNDVIDDINAAGRRHFISRASRPALDPTNFFGAMYRRGIGYFDYLDGLQIDADSMASILRGVGAEPTLGAEDLSAIGALLQSSGVTPAIGRFIPLLLVDVLLSTYPATSPRIDTMQDFEEMGQATDIAIGGTTWSGWSIDDGAVQVLESAGHSAGGCVFYLPDLKFLMLADETTTAPIWADSKPANTTRTARRALEMMDSGHLQQICAGHNPMLPQRGDDARNTLHRLVNSAGDFAATVEAELARHPGGLCIDELFAEVTAAAVPGSIVHALWQHQFPVFATFLKLTLLNHCLLIGCPQGVDRLGRTTFGATGLDSAVPDARPAVEAVTRGR